MITKTYITLSVDEAEQIVAALNAGPLKGNLRKEIAFAKFSKRLQNEVCAIAQAEITEAVAYKEAKHDVDFDQEPRKDDIERIRNSLILYRTNEILGALTIVESKLHWKPIPSGPPEKMKSPQQVLDDLQAKLGSEIPFESEECWLGRHDLGEMQWDDACQSGWQICKRCGKKVFD